MFDFFAFFCLARIDTRIKLLAITCRPIPLKILRLRKSIFMVIWQKNAKRVWSMINFVNFVFPSLWITAQPVYSLVLLKNIVYDFALESQVSQGEPQKSGYMKHVWIGPEYPTIYGYIRFYLDISQCFALSAITAWQSEWFFSLYVDHFEFPMFWPAFLKIYRCFCGKLAEYTVI